MKSLRVATCQFAVEPDVAHNRKWVISQIERAAAQRADVAHFSECALSGYAGVEFPDTSHINWSSLHKATCDIMAAAKKHRVWVLLGSTHRLDDRTKPHNSVYVIGPQGRVVDRYDKRFCTGNDGPKPTFDLCHYTPGNRPVVFKIKGVTCAVSICYDYRFPELYRELKQLGTQIVFQSFHNARRTIVDDPKYNIWKSIVPATMQCRAAENHFWVSANNSVARPSMWPSFTVQPDGAIAGRLQPHRPGVLITDMVMRGDFLDAPHPWRDSAIRGQLHSGRLVEHPRTRDVTCL